MFCHLHHIVKIFLIGIIIIVTHKFFLGDSLWGGRDMKKNIPINHHYIPQFILRNFSDDNKKINVYNLSTCDLSVRNIRTQYSKDNLYKMSNIENVMHVEESFAKLECEAAPIITRINNSKSQVIVNRIELQILKKFFFLMSFRSERRMTQYRDSYFDPLTEIILSPQTKDHDYMDLWLRELKFLLDHDISEYKICDDLSMPIYLDFENTFKDKYMVVWRAYLTEDFIITDNCGTFERSSGGLFPGANVISFYPISYTKIIGFVTKAFEHKQTQDMHKSNFAMELFPFPRNRRVVKNQFNAMDEYVYKICKLTNNDVRYTNALLLNEATSKISFNELQAIGKSVIYYEEESNNKNDYSTLLEIIERGSKKKQNKKTKKPLKGLSFFILLLLVIFKNYSL